MDINREYKGHISVEGYCLEGFPQICIRDIETGEQINNVISMNTSIDIDKPITIEATYEKWGAPETIVLENPEMHLVSYEQWIATYLKERKNNEGQDHTTHH